MPYFSQLLLRNGTFLADSVILTQTGESRHESEVAALEATQWRINYVIRSLCHSLFDTYGNDLNRIREESIQLDKEKLPNALYCPLTMNLFQVPVIAEDGHTYEEKAILAWFESCRAKGEAPSSPLCGRLKISPGGLVPNLLLSRVIEDALEQKRKNLQGDQPAVIRGIGDTSVEEILRAFSERLRNYFLPVAELATALSAEIIPAVTLSSQGDFEGGSQVLLVPTLNLVSAAFEASTEAVRDFSSTVIPRLLSSPKSGGGGAAKSSEREGDLQTSSFSRGR